MDREEPLEKEMTTHPSVLAWRIPWTEEPGRLQPMGSQMTEQLSRHARNILCILFTLSVYRLIPQLECELQEERNSIVLA